MTTLTNIRLITAFVSLLLSAFAYYTDDLLNGDGILYMELAQAYIDGGLEAASKLYNWPFFSILVAYFHQLTTLPIETSAMLINTLLFVVLTDALLLLSNKILPNTRQLIIASMIIICFASLNEYRHFIMRDIGYWAFGSLLLYRLIIYIESSTFKNAALWQLVAGIAILFRIEGTVLLLGMPLSLFTIRSSFREAIQHYIKLYSLFILGALIASTLLLDQVSISSAFAKINNIAFYMNLDAFLTTFSHNSDIIKSQVLNQYSEDYSGFILASGLLMMFVYKFIKSLSLAYLILYFTHWWQQKHVAVFPYQRLIAYFALLNILLLIVFVFQRYFISSRYATLGLLSVLLLMLPRLCEFIEQAWLSKRKIIINIITIILLVSLIDSMTSSRSKSYIKDTAIWASQNLPENSKVLTDDKFIEYYFNKMPHGATIVKCNTLNSYQKYDYVIIVVKRKDAALKATIEAMNVKPNFSFESIYCEESKRGDKSCVYKVSHER